MYRDLELEGVTEALDECVPVEGENIYCSICVQWTTGQCDVIEHKERSDECVEEVSVGLLLAQRGLAKYADYESATYAESDSHTEESCEYEEKTLEFQESDFKFTSEALETSTESKRDSSSTDLLDKILASDVSPTPAKQLLKPSELTAKAADNTSENCDSNKKHAEPSTSLINEVESSLPTTTKGNESRDRRDWVTARDVISCDRSDVSRFKRDFFWSK